MSQPSNKKAKSSANDLTRQQAKKLVRTASTTGTHSIGTARFHIPHKFGQIAVNEPESQPDLIRNLRPIPKPITAQKVEVRKRDVPVKRAYFQLPSDTTLPKRAPTKKFEKGAGDGPRLRIRPPVIDLNELIERKIKSFNDNRFIYLTYGVSKQSEYFTPYCLIEVPFRDVNRSAYYTISRHGVTYFSTVEDFFTPLAVWQTEYRSYCKLLKLNTYANFRIWKGFKLWQKTVQWKRYHAAHKFLEENLFIATPPLATAILQLRRECVKFERMSFADVSQRENQHLFYFIEAQMLTYETARDELIRFRNEMSAILYHACLKALISKGFLPGDEALVYTTVKKLREMMSSTDRARKRRYCILLANFLSYCDYMTITFLHEMFRNTFDQLAQLFRDHDSCRPKPDKLVNFVLDQQIEEPRPVGMPRVPLFNGELVLEPEKIQIEPSKQTTMFIFNQIIDLILDAVYNVERFQSDEMYLQFTKPCIMGRQEDRLGGKPPNINFVMNDDYVMNDNRQFIFDAIQSAYDTAELYLTRFDPIRANYEIDINTDHNTITSERSEDGLRKLCLRYKSEMAGLEGIVPSIRLGVLQLKQGTFKEEVIPVCHDLLVVLNSHIPKIAMAMVKDLSERTEVIMDKLAVMPENTPEVVAYLHYLDVCGKDIEQLISEVDFAYQCYLLMAEYDIFVDEMEKESYMDCEDEILHSKEVLEAKQNEKPEHVVKLNEFMQEDIRKLFLEIDDVRTDTMKDWLTDESSNLAEVKETISNLMDQLGSCQEKAQEYKKYQKEFKLDVTRFDTMDSVLNEVKLRKTLWDSAEEWEKSLQVWNTQSFNTLDVDELTSVTTNILKNCTVLEKNLPKNKIVSRLRYDAEVFKQKLPAIQYLRNPAFKPRHWLKVEQIINRKVFQDDTVTLAVYEEAGAFTPEMFDDITEVSGQASAELSLELLLKKVEYSWKELELSVVSHRDAKDVFILAGLDELQTALDESNININTLAASRHVGPIKSRVEDWQRQLDLFAETLEEWTTCQTSWIYLEAIFSAPDIQRQLPTEARMFIVVDKSWKDIMRRAYKTPLALPNMTDPKTNEILKQNNVLLDKITKCLEAYLEVKRVAFSRFYFLSNDELLEILAQTRNPHAVQPHLRKCFDAIAQLQFGTKDSGEGKAVMTNDIIAMISPEGEKILLGVGLKARGPVEDWLGKVEEAMFIALKRCMKFAYRCYPNKDRSEWFQDHANQIVLTVSQQQWAVDVHAILEGPNEMENFAKMQKFEQKMFSDLAKLAAIARTDISKLLRRVLCALITIDVHARDTITGMVNQRVVKVNDFNWLKMLRYYWIDTTETIQTKMSSASLPYFYEYLGAGGVLVITPLTDRCYLCLMGALQMDLGGAPAGPAGTGKTETTKDLAKALAKQCVVFNCSEGLDYKMMGRFFSGLAQSGAWCCFDEFNRIDIEVLSVIAQQLITIRNAKAARMKRFMFEGREIKLNMSCAAFITMNPGYAGRTELPDNLKALFRPMSMMVPDYALIAEVILYSEGFESSKILAKKMVQMYKLCSEQLSQQDHYDFGMRAVKSVLVMAGALKRAAPNQSEDITLISALRDSNLPKFLSDDAVLFKGILSDLFPGLELPIVDYGALQECIVHCMVKKNLQPIDEHITKNIQLYETMGVRWGVMLVGPTGSGKTSILHTLACALSKLHEDEVPGPNYRHVRMNTMNPKSISADELYGAVNPTTLEWKDGLLGLAVRYAVNVTKEEHQWIVCDGPVDAVWIENLNTVLDDNKMLCLANSERIKLTAWVHMVFEVQDLAQASPATVSRCGMVYVDPGELGWMPIVKSWRNTVPEKQISSDLLDFIVELFDKYLELCLRFVRRKCLSSINQVDVSKVSMLCTLLFTLTKEVGGINQISNESARTLLCRLFIWAMLWSVGGNLVETSRVLLEQHIRQLTTKDPLAGLPEMSLWDFKINLTDQSWESWTIITEPFVFDPDVRFFDVLVPTTETAKFGYIAEKLFRENRPVMFTGDTGVGKSVLAKTLLRRLVENDVIPVFLNFSAQTSSIGTQEMIEARLEKRKRTLLGPPIGKTMIYFVDDVNMPKLDTYGSQPPIELLRQMLDFSGTFDREKMFWKDLENVVFGCACAPPGGGRNPLTARFVRHFALLLLSPPNDATLTVIFRAIISGFLEEFNALVKIQAIPIVEAAVSVYSRIAQELLPTPSKSHYVFNLRDLSKCVQGILQADSSNYNQASQIHRLFYHESMRVFHDRLINDEDKSYFKNLMHETCVKYFNDPIVKSNETVLFGDFMLFGQSREDRIYEEIKDQTKLKSILFDYLDDYNSVTGKEVKLIMFEDAIEHVTRLARLLRAERANGLLVGLSGMGKQSLCRLGAHINGYRCVQIELTRGYDSAAFHEDLRNLYWLAGVQNAPTVFLITDTQICHEEFLEDINNILNSGEVPNLYESDEYEKVILGTRDDCIKAKFEDLSRDGIFTFFINRVRANLHIVLCMSPVGDAFRRRCRMFPSLVNCCTIDWFVKWPPDALYSVAVGSLATIAQEGQEHLTESLAKTCVVMHETVENASEKLFQEFRRHYYTTPSSYLELLKLYHSLLKARSDLIIAKRSRLSNGLGKILETNVLVAKMQVELAVLAPMLEVQSAEMSAMLTNLAQDNKVADDFKSLVMIDEADAMEKAVIARGIADEANKDLEVAQPALQAAQDALKAINKNDINELKSFAQPPALVQFVMESVCILFNVKPSWEGAKKIMADVNFLRKLMEFDKEHISESTLKKIKTYVDHDDFNPTKIEKVSKVAKSVSLWVIAMDQFAKIYKVVEPKIKKAREAENELSGIMAVLKQKQAELAGVEAQIQKLKDNIDEKNREFKVIQDDVDLTMGRLNRAGRLTSALSDEEVRWGEIVKQLTAELWAIPGDVLIASGYVAYVGAFPSGYRSELTALWEIECKTNKIPSSAEFNLVTVLGDSFVIRSWNMNGLPRDDMSIENGIVVTKALRWPLMIDPEEQANRWVRSMEGPNNLRITKITDIYLMRHLEICIRQGYPMLIEEIEETIDPSLAPILGRNIFYQAGRPLIKLGDTDVDYDENFKLYMTSKLSNPHYLPEVCVMVTIVNFLVTVNGLEDQLLADVVAIELPEMEKQRSDLIVRINTDKQQLLQLEDRVLKLLFAAKGNILDDEELVETLNEAKETSCIIAARLIDTEKTEAVITATREKYRILAARGAILFFVVTSLAEVDPMYQFSLKYFSSIFCSVIEAEHPALGLQERLAQLMADEIFAIYLNVSRGLFEKHKLIFSFLLSMAVEQQESRLKESEVNFFLRGPIGGGEAVTPKPKNLLISEYAWRCCLALEQQYKAFENVTKDLDKIIHLAMGELNEDLVFVAAKSVRSTKDWNSLKIFHKLMLINVVAPQKSILAISSFIQETLGKRFTDVAGNSSLPALYADTKNIVPLIFILSTGSDPMASFLRFTQEMNFMEKFHSISLGQGQGPAAEQLINRGRTLGHWVFLQNCHLATSWMPSLELIVRDMALGNLKAHDQFRLYLSSMPSKNFPVSVLQNSVKVTNEPPKGLKATLVRAFTDMDKAFFEQHALGDRWRAMVFGLCMFHGVILERRKFGPLGWNITYEFTESDRESGLSTLDMYCDREQVANIPWDALEYINGEVTWGGRVTDYWDQRCLKTILKIFSTERILKPGYVYSSSGVYRCPDGTTVDEFKQYAVNLPFNDDPEVFGMHENANLVFQTKETQFFIDTILLGQPRQSGGDSTNTSDDIVLHIIERVSSSIAKKIDSDDMLPELVQLDSHGRVPSLTTVLMQETDRFNKLLNIIHVSLVDLQRAIKGFVVMSESLEAVFNALLSDAVPGMWAAKGFLSTKSLGYWVVDFQHRIDYLQTWTLKGLPCSSWLSGLYFPQSFLTGTLQTHARKHNVPIDSLLIDYEVLPQTVLQADVYAGHQRGSEETSALYQGLEHPSSGIFIHGLFIEAGRWSAIGGGLCDSLAGELTPSLPAVWVKPCTSLAINGRYEAPLYKTQVRAGVLSTTGHSTNFVLTMYLISQKPADFWIQRGTALVTGITE